MPRAPVIPPASGRRHGAISTNFILVSSVLGTYEYVQPGYGRAPGYRDRVRLGKSPRHSQPVQRLAAEPVNVCRLVHEQITRIPIPSVTLFERPPDPVDPAVSVGVKEAAREVTRILCQDPLLPRLQFDHALVFHAWPVLREQA
jgi:hypothetical protein